MVRSDSRIVTVVVVVGRGPRFHRALMHTATIFVSVSHTLSLESSLFLSLSPATCVDLVKSDASCRRWEALCIRVITLIRVINVIRSFIMVIRVIDPCILQTLGSRGPRHVCVHMNVCVCECVWCGWVGCLLLHW